jgi:hypothetical protein
VPKKLVLAVIDSLKPEMLDQAVAEGHAPALAALLERGTYIRDCISTFPSVTPVASAAIATGCGPGEHHIPSMNWFHRGEERYVEYGSSLAATRAFGIVRSPSALGLPGQRDRHTSCVGAYLVEHDLFDFLLFSLPDNDTYSHKVGPDGQVRSIAEADRALERIMHVAGGPEAFLEEHAVIVMSDHSQTAVETGVNLADVLAEARVLTPSDPAPTEAELAACPSARSAMVYALDEGRRDELARRAADTLLEADGIELVITRDDGRALVRSERGELRFSPGDDLTDRRGRRWTLAGDESVLELETAGGAAVSETYPDGLARLWSALTCPHSGDVLVSAELGFEFVDWGGADHVGGGSHGSLHRDDSEGVLLLCGIDAGEREEWSLADVTPLVLEHFGVPLAG